MFYLGNGVAALLWAGLGYVCSAAGVPAAFAYAYVPGFCFVQFVAIRHRRRTTGFNHPATIPALIVAGFTWGSCLLVLHFFRPVEAPPPGWFFIAIGAFIVIIAQFDRKLRAVGCAGDRFWSGISAGYGARWLQPESDS